jgi:hypothetical protein
MMERYALLTAREKDGRSFFTKVGVMFPNRSGEGFTMYFEALPIPGPDGVKVIVKKAEPKPTGNREPTQADSYGEPAPF